MSKYDLAGEAPPRLGQCRGKIPEHQMLRVWRTVRIAVRLAFKHKDVAIRKMTAQMVEGPAVTKTQLEDDAGLAFDFFKRPAKTGMLRFQAKEKLFQSGE